MWYCSRASASLAESAGQLYAEPPVSSRLARYDFSPFCVTHALYVSVLTENSFAGSGALGFSGSGAGTSALGGSGADGGSIGIAGAGAGSGAFAGSALMTMGSGFGFGLTSASTALAFASGFGVAFSSMVVDLYNKRGRCFHPPLLD